LLERTANILLQYNSPTGALLNNTFTSNCDEDHNYNEINLGARVAVVSTTGLLESPLNLRLRDVVEVFRMEFNGEVLDNVLNEGLVSRDRRALANGHTLRNPRDENKLRTGREFIT